MISITKRMLMLLLTIMLATTTSFSSTILNGIENDSIITLTPSQLKQTNLIFIEHKKLLIENKLLKEQIDNYKEDNKLLIKTDSIRISQINIYKDLNNFLNRSLKNKRKSLLFWKIGGITISSSFLLLFLLK